MVEKRNKNNNINRHTMNRKNNTKHRLIRVLFDKQQHHRENENEEEEEEDTSTECTEGKATTKWKNEQPKQTKTNNQQQQYSSI